MMTSLQAKQSAIKCSAWQRLGKNYAIVFFLFLAMMPNKVNVVV